MASVAKMFKGGITIIVIVAIVVVGLSFNSFMDYVDNTEYAVYQDAFTGKLTVWNTPGWHVQKFGKVVKFPKAGDIFLSSDELDGGSGKEVQPVSVLFPDGNAKVDVVCRYEMSLIDSIQLDLYKKYGNAQAVHNMIRQQVIEAVKGVGPLMSSSEAYSDRKPEVAILARDMALKGIYASQVIIDTSYTVENGDTNQVVVKRYDVKLDANNNPIVTKKSILDDYNIILPVFNVKDMDFDKKTIALIEARKDAQLSKQSAITAYQKGLARVAEERATQEAIKIKAVTIAEKERDVAVLNAEKERKVAELEAEKAKQVALKTIREAKAQADANALKVKAGLTPQEKAEWQYKTTVDGIKAMYGPGIGSWDLPDIMSNGGSGEGSGGFMEALGMNQMLELQAKMTKNK